jgi:hypothetical protein
MADQTLGAARAPNAGEHKGNVERKKKAAPKSWTPARLHTQF